MSAGTGRRRRRWWEAGRAQLPAGTGARTAVGAARRRERKPGRRRPVAGRARLPAGTGVAGRKSAGAAPRWRRKPGTASSGKAGRRTGKRSYAVQDGWRRIPARETPEFRPVSDKSCSGPLSGAVPGRFRTSWGHSARDIGTDAARAARSRSGPVPDLLRTWRGVLRAGRADEPEVRREVRSGGGRASGAADSEDPFRARSPSPLRSRRRAGAPPGSGLLPRSAPGPRPARFLAPASAPSSARRTRSAEKPGARRRSLAPFRGPAGSPKRPRSDASGPGAGFRFRATPDSGCGAAPGAPDPAGGHRASGGADREGPAGRVLAHLFDPGDAGGGPPGSGFPLRSAPGPRPAPCPAPASAPAPARRTRSAEKPGPGAVRRSRPPGGSPARPRGDASGTGGRLRFPAAPDSGRGAAPEAPEPPADPAGGGRAPRRCPEEPGRTLRERAGGVREAPTSGPGGGRRGRGRSFAAGISRKRGISGRGAVVTIPLRAGPARPRWPALPTGPAIRRAAPRRPAPRRPGARGPDPEPWTS